MKKALPGKGDVEDSEVQIFIKSFGMQVHVCPMKWNMVQFYFTDLNGLRIPQSTTTDEWMA